MSLRFDLDVDTTRNLRDPLGLESLWVNRNLEKNGGFETLWVILPKICELQTIQGCNSSGFQAVGQPVWHVTRPYGLVQNTTQLAGARDGVCQVRK